MREPISLDAASLVALRDLIKDEVAAAVRSPAPKARKHAPPSEREGELLEIIRQLKDTIRDLRQELRDARSLRRDGDSPSRPTPSSPSPYSPSGEQKASYAAGLKSNPKPRKSQVVVQSIPPQGDPIQLVAAETAKLVSKYGCTVVQGRANYTDNDKKALGVKQIAARKKVSDWPVAEHSDIFRRVLLVGQTMHDAHAVAVQAMDKHAQTESVSALILSTTAPEEMCRSLAFWDRLVAVAMACGSLHATHESSS